MGDLKESLYLACPYITVTTHLLLFFFPQQMCGIRLLNRRIQSKIVEILEHFKKNGMEVDSHVMMTFIYTLILYRQTILRFDFTP